MSMVDGVRAFGKAFWYGGYLIFTDRRFIWLVPGYAFALYGHRYLENGLAPIYAKSIIGVSSYSQIIVGGSNFGELLGALSVMLFTQAIPTPMPWLRLDALLLNLVWVMPFFPYTRGAVSSAGSSPLSSRPSRTVGLRVMFRSLLTSSRRSPRWRPRTRTCLLWVR